MRPTKPWLICLLGLAATACGCNALNRDGDAAKDGDADAFANARPAPTPRILPETFLAAGQMLEQQNNLPGAIKQYEKAVAADPRNAEAYNRIGIAYQKLGRYGDADQILSAGIEAAPGSVAMRNNLGCSYLAQRRFEEAADVFREALAQSPDFKRARMNLAIALAQIGQLDQSAIEFSRVVPADVAYYNVAMVCMAKGDYENGRASLEQAVAINPECPGAKAHLDRLAALTQKDAPVPPELPPEPPPGPVADLAGSENDCPP